MGYVDGTDVSLLIFKIKIEIMIFFSGGDLHIKAQPAWVTSLVSLGDNYACLSHSAYGMRVAAATVHVTDA